MFQRDSRIEAALDTLPGQTLIANFTDWAAVRDKLGPDVSSRSEDKTRKTLFAQAYDRDFSTTSVLGAFDADMATTYGWTVLDSGREVYGQSKDGAVDVLLMPDGFDFARAATALTRLGYTAANEHGVRFADDQTLAGIANRLAPQLTAVAVLPDDHLIVMSDAAAHAGLTVDTIHGDGSPVLDEEGVADTAAALADTSVSALVDIGDNACTATGFQDADQGQQAPTRDSRRWPGSGSARPEVSPRYASGPLRRRNQPAHSRAGLRVLRAGCGRPGGPGVAGARRRPDQGETFDERFSIASADVTGEVMTLVLAPRSSDTQLLRDIGRGGLLFAAC